MCGGGNIYVGKGGVLYKTPPASATYPPTPGVLSLALWNPCTKKIFFHREEAWCHVISVCHHMHGQCLMSHVCVYLTMSMSLCYICLCLCYYILSSYIPLIVLILKLYTMLTLMLGFPVALSDAKDWTPVKKGIALIWIGLLDTLIIGLCCW